jgi:hypothetical protein
VTDKKGASRTLKTKIEIKDDTPLLVSVEKNTETGEWISKLITSGKVIARHDNGAKFETVYTNVKYTQEGGCLPVSGSISGSVYGNDDAEVDSRTYTIDFDSISADGAEIVFADGGRFRFAPEGCEFELAKTK